MIRSFIIVVLAVFTLSAAAQDISPEEMENIVSKMQQQMQDTVNKMQQEMDEKVSKIQQKMEAMETSIKRERLQFNDNIRSMEMELGAEREHIREAAGGAPEALRSNSGSATVRVGGSLQIRYYANFDPNYHQAGQPQSRGGEYATRLGWTMDTASITFNMQFNEDLSMFIDVRPSNFDKAYFQWNNIGGSGLGTQVGFIGIPGGMYSSSTDMWGRVFITNPVVKEFSQAFIIDQGPSANNPSDDIKRMGLKLFYKFNDELTLTGVVFSPSDLGNTADLLAGYDSADSTTILAPNGDPRNNGFMNNGLSLEYRPAMIEGLLLSATYLGLADLGQGTYTEINRRGSSFSPHFDLGIAYLQDKFGVYLETAYTLNPGFYSDTYNYCISLGADYRFTDRFAVAAGAAYGLSNSSSDLYKARFEPESFAPNYPNLYISTVRLRLGLRYDFANGVWLKGEYGHLITTALGMGDSNVKNSDHFTFETGLIF